MEEELRRCSNGHYYHGDSCPYCNPKIKISKPKNYLVWSILATICCCLPFGIVSIVHASNVDRSWALGDYDGAIKSAKNAKKWLWISVIIGFVASLIYILYYVVIMIASVAIDLL